VGGLRWELAARRHLRHAVWKTSTTEEEEEEEEEADGRELKVKS